MAPRGRSLTRPRPPAKVYKPKAKKTRTCLTCAETYKTHRSDGRFCCTAHRVYYHEDRIPKAIQESTTALRAERTERSRRARAKRVAEKALKDHHAKVREIAVEIFLEDRVVFWADQIEAEADQDQKQHYSQCAEQEREKYISGKGNVPAKYTEAARKVV